ncbi:hypothetical protein [Halanaerobium congolense]|nr:hypothetical protein [Halanaerobium congolense]
MILKNVLSLPSAKRGLLVDTANLAVNENVRLLYQKFFKIISLS